jgi:uncharacterized membrane protein YgdD (TMEM256/DUF423 family)
MNKKILAVTAFLGGLGVVTGAMAAHALKNKLSAHALESVHTAVLYQMIHVLAILMLAGLYDLPAKIKNKIATIFLLGILFFSGSIYMISIFQVNPTYIWFITPLGGIMFILAWFYLAWSLIVKKN